MGSAYRDRPWLRLYQQGKPADIGDALAAALAARGLGRGDRIALPKTPTGKLLRRELRDHARDLL